MGLFLIILGWIWSVFFGLGVIAMLTEKNFGAVVLLLALMAPGFVMIKKGLQRRDAAVPKAPPPPVQVKCQGCGAGNVIRFGTTGPCEFCGAPLASPTH